MEISIEREREGENPPPTSRTMGINKDFAIFLRRAHPKASCLKGERRFSVFFFVFFSGEHEERGMERTSCAWECFAILIFFFPSPLGWTRTRVVWNFLLSYGPRNPVALAASGCLDSLNASIISNGFGWVVKTSMCLIWLGGGGRETARLNWLIVIWSLHWESKSAKCHWRRSSIY